jgi:hypothetical protein
MAFVPRHQASPMGIVEVKLHLLFMLQIDRPWVTPKLTRRRLKRGVCRSLVELHAATNRFIEAIDRAPRPSPGPPIPTQSSPPPDAGTDC